MGLCHYLFLLCVVSNVSLVLSNKNKTNYKFQCSKSAICKGLYAPVFAAFYPNGTLNTDIIRNKYATFLTTNNVRAVDVNTDDAGGNYLSQSERLQQVAEWVKVAKKCGIQCVTAHIPSMPIYDLISESLKVKKLKATAISIKVGYNVNSTAEIVRMGKRIGDIVYPLTVFLDVPGDLHVNVARLHSEGNKAFANFGGVRTTVIDCVEVISINKYSRHQGCIARGSSTLAIAYFAGATATSSLMANIYPKRLTQILQAAAQDNTYFRKISDMQKSFNEMIATAESFLDLEQSKRSSSTLDLLADFYREICIVVTKMDLGRRRSSIDTNSRIAEALRKAVHYLKIEG